MFVLLKAEIGTAFRQKTDEPHRFLPGSADVYGSWRMARVRVYMFTYVYM
ncbi:hypothetical protein SAMN06295900_117122 [Trinickia caryophylli]|uniref:Uncharacterized protein n=1 Tax=Trinickia caryophylli TaxID=28094 RepID=A0A1X7GRX9_TRICW|nr:hypothetical protein SAMN06295900_117122 [Trinickia caryophylli]